MIRRRFGPGARYSLDFYLRILLKGHRPIVMQNPRSADRVVVLAPHPDDETIGCGGVLRQYVLANTPVTIIFISDGRLGDPDLKILGRGTRPQDQQELADEREEEAKKAAETLGVSDLIFLHLPDGNVRATSDSIQALSAQLNRLEPDIVFLPFLADQHPDHFETNVLFLQAVGSGYRGREPECWAYEIWTPLFANRVVNITGVAETKWAALRQYESQNRNLDYLSTTKGLNAYRWIATHSATSGFAEAFFACSLSRYRSLYNEVRHSLRDFETHNQPS
jgi:LmbE family N-acetylglucosaminyl deacetylase